MKKSAFILSLLLCAFPFFCSAAPIVGLAIFSKTDVLSIGEPVTLEVQATTQSQPVNAIEAELSYNPRDFSVEKILTEGSILTLYATTPTYDSASGIIHFSGWTGTPYLGEKGRVLSVVLVPLRVGQSAIDFNSGVMLSATENGSNVITDMQAKSFRIIPKISQTPIPAAPATPPVQPSVTEPQTTASTGAELPSTPTTTAPNQNAAAAVFGVTYGLEFAPWVLFFFIVLAILAFIIAYILHRVTRKR